MISAVPSDDGPKVTRIRDTSATDRPIDPAPQLSRRRIQYIAAGVGALALLLIVAFIVSRWLSAEVSVPRERVRIAEVTRGAFIRDVSAQGTVVAAVSPTLFSPATGTVHFLVQAGDVVKKTQPIATVESPELRNELEREQATLAGLEIAVQRQSIDTRRQLLANQQASDLANVNIQAAERELRRAEDSWGKKLISERDFESGERRLRLRQLVAQLGAVDFRDDLLLLDDIAGLHEEVHRAGRRRVQSRADGCDDGALRRDVTNELAARDFGDAHALERDGSFGRQPVPHQQRDQSQHQDATDAGGEKEVAPTLQAGFRIDRTILRRRVANARDLGTVVVRDCRNHRLCSAPFSRHSLVTRGRFIV